MLNITLGLIILMGEKGPGFDPTQIGLLLKRYPMYIRVHYEGFKLSDQPRKLRHVRKNKLFLGDPIYIGA